MVGHHLGQLIIRFGLAATFLTMGLAKVMRDQAFEGQAAADLANMGVITPATNGPAPDADDPEATDPDPDEDSDGGDVDPISFRLQPDDPPAQPPADPDDPADEPADDPADPDTQPSNPPSRATQPDDGVRSLTPRQQDEIEDAQESAEEAAEEAAEAANTPRYTAADFPEPVTLPRVYGIALMLRAAAHPEPNQDGTDRMALVPSWAADTNVPGLGMATPVVLAWLVAITEIVGGGMLLVGFMSRLWALGLVGVMIGAIWLTAIGPAMQAGTAYLGFLPNHGHIFDFTEHGPAYLHEFWQLALLCMAAAILFAGPGAISVDGILFGGARDNDHGDD